jgi:hypothetical protein
MSAGGYGEVDSFMPTTRISIGVTGKGTATIATHTAKVQNLFSSTSFFLLEDRADNNRKIHTSSLNYAKFIFKIKRRSR